MMTQKTTLNGHNKQVEVTKTSLDRSDKTNWTSSLAVYELNNINWLRLPDKCNFQAAAHSRWDILWFCKFVTHSCKLVHFNM